MDCIAFAGHLRALLPAVLIVCASCVRAFGAESPSPLEASLRRLLSAVVGDVPERGRIEYESIMETNRPFLPPGSDEAQLAYNRELADGVRSFKVRAWWSRGMQRADVMEVTSDPSLPMAYQIRTNLHRPDLTRFTGWREIDGNAMRVYLTRPADRVRVESLWYIPTLYPEESFPLALWFLSAPPRGSLESNTVSFAGMQVDEARIAEAIRGTHRSGTVELRRGSDGSTVVALIQRGGTAPFAEYELAPSDHGYVVQRVALRNIVGQGLYEATRDGVLDHGIPRRFVRVREKPDGERTVESLLFREWDTTNGWLDSAIFLPADPVGYDVHILEADGAVTVAQSKPGSAWPADMRWDRASREASASRLRYKVGIVLVLVFVMGCVVVLRLRTQRGTSV